MRGDVKMLEDSGLPDKWRDACGVFGVVAPGTDVARLTYFGLFALVMIPVILIFMLVSRRFNKVRPLDS